MTEKNTWLAKSIAGILLTGAGLSASIDAGIAKSTGADHWIIYGTISLMVFMSGLILMIDSVRHRR